MDKCNISTRRCAVSQLSLQELAKSNIFFSLNHLRLVQDYLDFKHIKLFLLTLKNCFFAPSIVYLKKKNYNLLKTLN